MEPIRRLWAGEVPLETTFWVYTITVGFVVNALATMLAMILASADASSVLIIGALVLPIPYNVFTLVAVWRSAERYQGERRWAEMARIAAVVWAALASIL